MRSGFAFAHQLLFAARRLRPIFGVWLALVWGAGLFAHPMHFTRLGVSVAPEEAELRVDINLTVLVGDDYDALLHASPEKQTTRLPELAGQILHGISPVFTPSAGEWRLVSWKLPAPPDEQNGNPDELGYTTFVWHAPLPALPPDATFQVVSRPDAQVDFPVACSLSFAGREGVFTKWLQTPGDATKPLKLAAPPPESKTTAPANTAGNASANASPTDAPAAETPTPTGTLATAGQYLWLGFLHILPMGVDHILFVLGLYFLGAGWRALAAQIGTFTLAHTTTLGLAAAGIVRVSPSIVEPLIALSISFVALENIFRPRVGAERLAAVFLFGLLHGLGFAGALSELELPRDRFFTALLSFNFGVDFGQLAVLALAFLTVGWFRARPWYRAKIAIPACALIAATGVYWTIERTFF